jgi:ubiquinone/menaquinone biosynthesis C-methylase UbiE
MKVRDSGMPDQTYWESLLNVNLILEKLEVDEQIDSLVEFGSGYGTFTLPSAERIRGNVIALDIESQMIEIATTRAVSHKSINFIKRDFIVDGTGLGDNSVDYVMLFNILHHNDPLEILNETYRILKIGGKAGLIHWNYDPTTPRGPNLNIRPKPAEMRQWAISAGFKLTDDPFIDLPPYHYGFLAYKR